ncbi:hypothetical protein, partial [Burkholderia sp. Cy-647]|uniref:hypothetical protein n=1 Tax=Burkholderia sp. Cy-647 TaxID=2608328 RepID=UPI001962FEB1
MARLLKGAGAEQKPGREWHRRDPRAGRRRLGRFRRRAVYEIQEHGTERGAVLAARALPRRADQAVPCAPGMPPSASGRSQA